MAKANKQVKVTLVKSLSGRLRNHRACANGLGLKRIHQTVTVEDSPENRGMIKKIADMLVIEEV